MSADDLSTTQDQPIDSAFPFASYRPYQREILAEAAETLFGADAEYDNLVVYAPTGIGKSPINVALARLARALSTRRPRRNSGISSQPTMSSASTTKSSEHARATTMSTRATLVGPSPVRPARSITTGSVPAGTIRPAVAAGSEKHSQWRALSRRLCSPISSPMAISRPKSKPAMVPNKSRSTIASC